MKGLFSRFSTHQIFWKLVAIGVLLILTIVILYVGHPQVVRNAKEDITFYLAPSDELAFSYGENHFNAADADDYDINRAQYFLNTTRLMNPKHPLVHHELARIAFLKGNQTLALSLINTEFLVNPKPSPSSYYVRALIKAYTKDYKGAASDYEVYFKATPATWGSINDYAWVLMKMDYFDEALKSLDWGLSQWPKNAWLLSNKATALYELGRFAEAKKIAREAQKEAVTVTVQDWLMAYPGNDPLIAKEGLEQFKKSVSKNLTMIEKVLAK